MLRGGRRRGNRWRPNANKDGEDVIIVGARTCW